MKQNRKTSISLTEDELGILDASSKRMGISRSEVVRHLILYHGLTGGDFPLTSRILSLKPNERERIVAEIRAKSESENPPKPQSFKAWVKEVLGKDDPETIERGTEALLRSLLD